MSFNIEHFLAASLAVQIHVVTALFALFVGLYQFSRRKGGSGHRMVGKIWVSAMVFVALSSFFIHQINPSGLFSPIHLLSVFVLGSLYFSIRAVKSGNIRAHEFSMLGMFLGGLVFAGALTFSRGLLMSKIFLTPNIAARLPSPTELPGGGVGTAFIGFFAVLIVVFMLNYFRSKGGASN